MTAKNRLLGTLIASSLAWPVASMVAVPSVVAQEAPEAKERERAELPPLTAQIPPEEALAAIKRRAKKILEARRAARRIKTYVEASEALAYETNPATATDHKGNSSIESSIYAQASKQVSPILNWTATYSGSYLKYEKYRDGEYTDHILTPVKLRWQPGRVWRVESWMDLEHNYYPQAKDSGYRQVKLVGRLRQNLWESWYHQFQYEWFDRGYTHKEARDGTGRDTGDYRQDFRNRFRYKVGKTVKKALVSVENEYYKNNSNDNRNNYYDYWVWKVSNSVSGSVTKKLYCSAGFNFERKNYEVRPVSGISAEARYDDKYTFTSNASYDINDMWKVAYGLTFDHLASNESTGEYDNAKHGLTVTARF